MYKRAITAVFAIVLLLSSWASAAEIGGELQSGAVYELEEGITEVPIRFKLALEERSAGRGKMYLSLKGLFDPLREGDEQLSLSLDEAYMAIYLNALDLVVGRQVISWGTADGFNPTNYFARLSEEALLEGSLRGEPVMGVQAAYYHPDWSVTGVVLPVFSPQKLSGRMRGMFESQPTGPLLLQAIEEAERPDPSLTNMEFGLRAETSVQGWDLQLSGYYGFESLPGITMSVTFNPQPQLVFEGEYRRQWYVGAATAGFLGDWGVKAEVAYGGPVPFEDDVITMSQNEAAWKGVVGAEYMVPVGNGVLVQAEYIYEGSGGLFTPYRDPMIEPEPGQYLMGRVSYNFTFEDSVELAALYSLQDKSAVLMPGFKYRLPQGLELQGSILKAVGEGELELVPDQVRLAVTYRF